MEIVLEFYIFPSFTLGFLQLLAFDMNFLFKKMFRDNRDDSFSDLLFLVKSLKAFFWDFLKKL